MLEQELNNPRDVNRTRLFSTHFLNTVYADREAEEVFAFPDVWSGGGEEPVVIFRDPENDRDALFLAAKGGRAADNHGNMDAGSFIFEIEGVRWSVDPGNQGYGELEQITATACGASGGTGGGGGGTPTDTDSDGVADSTDNCVFIPNPDQGDTDNDGVGDVCDNCLLKANADQLDVDGDGFGNACDGDLNNDLIVNSQDIGLYKAAFFTQGVSSADFNGDGIVNSLDTGLLKLMLFKPPGL